MISERRRCIIALAPSQWYGMVWYNTIPYHTVVIIIFCAAAAQGIMIIATPLILEVVVGGGQNKQPCW